jgi:hypothetical protein
VPGKSPEESIGPLNISKDELSKRSIKTAASKLYGITIASKKFQKMSNWRRIEKDVKVLIDLLAKENWNPKKSKSYIHLRPC